MHHRGAGGIRTAYRQRHHRLCRRRLREDTAGSGKGIGRDRLGRREQRHLVLRIEHAHRDRRPPSARTRDAISSGRDERAHGRRRDHQQGEHS